MNEHREGFRHSGVEHVVALDDGFVDPRTTLDIVRLDGEQLLKRIAHAVRLECPHLHFAHTLTAHLRLAAERLLRDKGVRSDGTGVDLVCYEVVKLEHVDHTDHDALGEGFTRETIVENRLAVGVDPGGLAFFLLLLDAGLTQALVDLRLLYTVEARRCGVEAEEAAGKAKVRLEQLSEVHTGRHAQRVEHDIDRRSVGEERHVAARKDAGNAALVTVTAGHLVTDGEVLLVHEIYADLLDDSAIIAEFAKFAVSVNIRSGILKLSELGAERINDRVKLLGDLEIVDVVAPVGLGKLGERRTVDLLVGGDDDLLRDIIHNVACDLLVEESRVESRDEFALDLLDLLGDLLLGVTACLLRGLAVAAILGGIGGGHLNGHDNARRSRRNGEGRVAHISSLLAEDCAKETLFRAELRLALRRDLSDENVARLHLCADADDAVGTEVLESILTDVRDVARDFFGTELRVTCTALEGDDMQGRKNVLAHKALVDENGVFEVVAAPGHERHEQVLAECELATVGRRTVRKAVAGHDLLAALDDRLLVEARAGVAAAILLEGVAADAFLRLLEEIVLGRILGIRLNAGRQAAVGGGENRAGIDIGDNSRLFGAHDDAAVLGGDAFKAGTDERTLRTHERNALTHHVRAHERTVCVVVFKERNETGSDGDHLHRRNVHVLDLGGRHIAELSLPAAGHLRFGERLVVVERSVGLGDHVLLFSVGREILDRVRDLAVADNAVRSLDETEAVDLGVEAEGRDKTDVRTFRRLNRADAAVVRRMHVADFEACALAGETARTESRETALVGKSGKRVRLIHELRQLAARKEVLDHGRERLGVDQARRRERTGHSGVVHRHAFADETLRTGETDAALVLHELGGRADATVAEMVDVVDRFLAHVDLEEEADRFNHVDAALVERAELLRHLAGKTELLVDLVATDIAEVVVAKLEEEFLEHRLRVRCGRRISGTDATVDVFESILLVVNAGLGVLTKGLDEGTVIDGHIHHFDGGDSGGVDLRDKRRGDGIVAAGDDSLGAIVDEVVLDHETADHRLGVLRAGVELLERVEKTHDVDIKAVSERTEERGRVEFTTAAALVHEAPHHVVGVEHDFDPVSAVRDDAHGKKRLTVGVNGALRGDAGTAVELGDDHALRTVDDKRAVTRHHRNFTEEHILFAHILAILEAELGVKRLGVGMAIAERLCKGVLLRTEFITHKIEHIASVKARHGEDFAENCLKTLVLALRGRNISLQKIIIALRLDLNEIRRIVGILEFPEYFAFGFCHVVYLSCRIGHNTQNTP